MRILSATLWCLVAVAIASCALLPPGLAPRLVPGADDVVVTVDSAGGLCPDGVCTSRIEVRGDGTVTASGTANAATGRIPAAQLGELEQLIAGTDWGAVAAVPFTGTCPTAYDGQERTYTLPTGAGNRVIASCTSDLEGVPAIAAIDEAVAAALR